MYNDANAIYYSEYEPAENLRQFISAYWKFEYNSKAGDVFPHIVLPDGCPSLIFFRAKKGKIANATLFGPRANPYPVDIYPATVVVGVRFFPGAISHILNISASALRNKNINAHSYLKHEALTVFADSIYPGFNRFENLDAVFSEIIEQRGARADEAIRYAVNCIIDAKGKRKVGDIALECGLGLRQLQRKFRQQVGLSLKEFARIRRMRSVLADLILKKHDIQDALFRAGYFDQSHFNKDLSYLSGMNPTRLIALYTQIHHGNVL